MRDAHELLRIGCPCLDHTHSLVVGSIRHLVGA